MTLLNKILQLIGQNVIVEHGTSGIWTYDKYANGDCKIRGTYYVTTSTIAVTTAYGNIYMSDLLNVTLPFSLTTDYATTSQVYISPVGTGTDWAAKCYMSSANTASFFWINPVPYTVTARSFIECFILGKWK